MRIPVNNYEYVNIEPRPDDTVCEVHDWDGPNTPKRLMDLMRERHNKGGVNVCVECIERIKQIGAHNARTQGGLV